MDLLASAPYLAALVPLVLSAVIAAGVRVWGKAAPWVALVGPLSLVGIGAASLTGGGSGAVRWISAGSSVISLGWHADGLAAVMLLVVGVVAACVMLFSVGYMHGERGYVRYFAILSLFTAAMAWLVIASDLVGLFLGWELVGHLLMTASFSSSVSIVLSARAAARYSSRWGHPAWCSRRPRLPLRRTTVGPRWWKSTWSRRR
jgi:NADH:ubiquinone oxidoreductase subunit 5 (subunit L)/multisubunit Na+/H+ antiporter MnhA subunit